MRRVLDITRLGPHKWRIRWTSGFWIFRRDHSSYGYSTVWRNTHNGDRLDTLTEAWLNDRLTHHLWSITTERAR